MSSSSRHRWDRSGRGSRLARHGNRRASMPPTLQNAYSSLQLQVYSWLLQTRLYLISPFLKDSLQPVGQEQDNDQHRESENEHVVVWKFSRQQLLQQRENGCPGDGRVEVSHAAEYGHEDRHERVLDTERRSRVDIGPPHA